MAPERFRALAEAAAYVMGLVDTSSRYGVPLRHSVHAEARRRLNAALHPDYHIDRYGGVREGVPYVNDAVEHEREAS